MYGPGSPGFLAWAKKLRLKTYSDFHMLPLVRVSPDTKVGLSALASSSPSFYQERK